MKDFWLGLSVLLLGLGLGSWLDVTPWGLVIAAVALLVIYLFQIDRVTRVGRRLQTQKSGHSRWVVPLAKKIQDLRFGLEEEISELRDSESKSTEQSRSRRAALEGAVAEFRSLIDTFPDGLMIIDENEHLLQWNPVAGKAFGLSPALDKKKPIRQIIRAPEFDALLDHSGSEPIEFWSSMPVPRFFSARVFTLQNLRKLVQFQDITRLRQLEEVRQDFVANASHELRTPLTVVHGYLETLIDHAPDETKSELRHIFSQMHAQTTRIKRIVEDMLVLSRLDKESAPLEEELNIREALERSREEGEMLSGGKRHRITLDIAVDSVLRANREEFDSVISNLISNAVRYTPSEGAIDISWWVSSEGGYLSIKDTGIGIDRQHIDRLTERFYRVDVARSRELGGTGLGLSIVKHALSRMDGELNVTSRLGEGSRFVCRFPVNRLN